MVIVFTTCLSAIFIIEVLGCLITQVMNTPIQRLYVVLDIKIKAIRKVYQNCVIILTNNNNHKLAVQFILLKSHRSNCFLSTCINWCIRNKKFHEPFTH